LGLPPFSALRFLSTFFADTAGPVHTRNEWNGKRAVVLLFLTTDCPLSNGYVPGLNRLRDNYTPRGVLFYGVQGDATIAENVVRKHVKDFSYTFPYLFDPKEALATLTGATTTPAAAVLSPEGELLYLGRIDNKLEDWGKQRVQVTEFDLQNALEAVLDGKPVPRPRTKALACTITRK
jgi:thiol-disulfide isomerase/thioredoxin